MCSTDHPRCIKHHQSRLNTRFQRPLVLHFSRKFPLSAADPSHLLFSTIASRSQAEDLKILRGKETPAQPSRRWISSDKKVPLQQEILLLLHQSQIIADLWRKDPMMAPHSTLQKDFGTYSGRVRVSIDKTLRVLMCHLQAGAQEQAMVSSSKISRHPPQAIKRQYSQNKLVKAVVGQTLESTRLINMDTPDHMPHQWLRKLAASECQTPTSS